MDLMMVADIPTGGDEFQQAIAERFKCARCGFCCKGDGIVRFGPAEADRMAGALGLKRRQFLNDYALPLDGHHWILRDRIVPGPLGVLGREKWCIFLERHPDGRYGCRLGDAKPRQCKDFPYDWTNPDSMETCAGLRLLRAELRQRTPDESASDTNPPQQ